MLYTLRQQEKIMNKLNMMIMIWGVVLEYFGRRHQ
jgi:hypothetical protein